MTRHPDSRNSPNGCCKVTWMALDMSQHLAAAVAYSLPVRFLEVPVLHESDVLRTATNLKARLFPTMHTSIKFRLSPHKGPKMNWQVACFEANLCNSTFAATAPCKLLRLKRVHTFCKFFGCSLYNTVTSVWLDMTTAAFACFKEQC